MKNRWSFRKEGLYNKKMIIKRLDIEDVEFFLDLRLKLFYELQEIDKNDNIENLKNSTKEHYLKNIDKSLITYGIFKENKIVSIGFLMLIWKDTLYGKYFWKRGIYIEYLYFTRI